MVAISEPGARPLRDIAAYHGFPCLDHAPELGGRFSVLATAMLPALVAGVDAAAVRAGAAAARDHALSQPAANSPPAIGAAINAALAAEGRYGPVGEERLLLALDKGVDGARGRVVEDERGRHR